MLANTQLAISLSQRGYFRITTGVPDDMRCALYIKFVKSSFNYRYIDLSARSPYLCEGLRLSAAFPVVPYLMSQHPVSHADNLLFIVDSQACRSNVIRSLIPAWSQGACRS